MGDIMKNLSLFFFIVILAGCGHKESNGQQLDLETIKKERKHPANTALPSDPISLNLVPT